MSDVTCDNCGACCRHIVQPRWTEGVRPGFPPRLMDELFHFDTCIRRSLPEDWPCCWLDLATMRCRHYEWRPEVCRENNGEGVMPGNEACLAHRKEWGIDNAE